MTVGGNKLWIPFSYESLPFYCYNCGCIGHFYKSCATYDRDDDSPLPFGNSIKAIMGKRSRNPKPEITYITTNSSPNLITVSSPNLTVNPSVPLPSQPLPQTDLSTSTPPQYSPAVNQPSHRPNDVVTTEQVFTTLREHLSISRDTNDCEASVTMVATTIMSSIQSKPTSVGPMPQDPVSILTTSTSHFSPPNILPDNNPHSTIPFSPIPNISLQIPILSTMPNVSLGHQLIMGLSCHIREE